ncbi:phenylacetic acid degradation-related protein [Desulfovibrio sp. X2]|uniref:PaaI family thioesterase n=1 Tax=Desulfovibrio sp. X2 TaxID=941449 RepID=UPI0003587465|nr:PaaI family thioesterase [Desulfovibrio sp. X2]EPR41104.1 phenylacetic acid degradation-related protein [Desulfovibrio sp. X2]
MDPRHLQEFIERGFPFHSLLGIKVDNIEEGSVRLYIPYQEQLLGHASRSMIHGGVISTLVDICGGFAVWTRCTPEDNLVTITLSVDFLRPATGDLYAEASVRLLGNRVGNSHVVVWSADDPNLHVAEGRGVYNIKRGRGRS